MEQRPGPNSKTYERKNKALRSLLNNPPPESLKVEEVSKFLKIGLHQLNDQRHRIRYEVRKFVKRKPWKKGLNVVWEDINGMKIPDKAFKYVIPNIGKYGSLKFYVELKSGSKHIFRYTVDEMKNLYKKKRVP